MSDAKQARAFCEEVEMTPSQCNEVVEDKLDHLRPVLQCALDVFQRVEHALANGACNWRVSLANAKKRVLGE